MGLHKYILVFSSYRKLGVDVVCLRKEHACREGKHLNVADELLRVLRADDTGGDSRASLRVRQSNGRSSALPPATANQPLPLQFSKRYKPEER